MHELSLRIGRAVQTHFQNFLCEERCDSFADSRSYCRWRSALIVKVMQLNQSGYNFGCVRSRGNPIRSFFVGSPTTATRTATFRGTSSGRRLSTLG
jgi:hypothetical protein